MNTYIVYWNTGDTEIISGGSPREAFRQAGYHFAALAGVYAIDKPENQGYTWHKETNCWKENEQSLEYSSD